VRREIKAAGHFVYQRRKRTQVLTLAYKQARLSMAKELG
jgi:hypothetical protein